MNKRIMMKGLPILLLAALAATPALGQQSESYKLAEKVFNEGGVPANGVVLASPSYRITLDGIGEVVVATGLAGTSYRIDASFTGGYPPPGEVINLRFGSETAMSWDAERAVGTYSVYRGLLSGLPGLGYGACFAQNLTVTAATDAASPGVGTGWFYLATAENRLQEEGTKGRNSAGAERPNPAPCP